MSEMLATRTNMRKLARMRTGAPLFAYSPLTYERYSATDGDYFMLPMDEPLKDSKGEPMVLAYSSEAISIVENA